MVTPDATKVWDAPAIGTMMQRSIYGSKCCICLGFRTEALGTVYEVPKVSTVSMWHLPGTVGRVAAAKETRSIWGKETRREGQGRVRLCRWEGQTQASTEH